MLAHKSRLQQELKYLLLSIVFLQYFFTTISDLYLGHLQRLLDFRTTAILNRSEVTRIDYFIYFICNEIKSGSFILLLKGVQ